MKIAHIITGLDAGGAEGVLVRLCKAESHRHLEKVVISLTQGGEYRATLEAAGVTVIELGMGSTISTFAAIRRLRQMLKELRPDVVQTWMYHADLIGGIAARLAGIRALLWGLRSSVSATTVMKRRTRFVIRLCAILSGIIPARIVVCASNVVDAHAKIGYRRDKMVVIQNGIDLTLFYRDDPKVSVWRDSNGLRKTDPLIGMVARVSPPKDHQNLLDALKQLVIRNEPFQCMLVGRGTESTNREFALAIEERGLSNHVIPMGARKDVPAIMRSMDLHVLSSRIEGFPNVLAEAMASGTPCISTDVGDAEYIIGEYGWLVPSADPIALADAIADALTERRNSPSQWERRRTDGEAHIRDNFGLQRMVDEFTALWAETARSCKRAARL